MKLSELFRGVAVKRIDGDTEVEIAGISYDSRRIHPGDLFFSLARDRARNRANLSDALRRGAHAVVVERWDEELARPARTIVEAKRPRLLMGVAASRLYAEPSRRVNLIGITGTSGKTSSTYLLSSIFEAAGRPAGTIGTIGIFVRGEKIYSGLTTPESVDFESSLAAMERRGVRDAFAEVSSIGIAEARVDALNFRAAMFTGFGRDHLDYHRDLEDYFAAKLRLFTELLPRSAHPDPIAVVRADDSWGKRVLDATTVRKLSFGLGNSTDAYPKRVEANLSGIRARLSVLGREIDISSPLVGELNLLNILGASLLSVALGIEVDAVAEGVARCTGAPGRMEVVPAKRGMIAIVDYAHKPDALEGVLRAIRALGARRIICVFGCGGDRDRGKRPLMGAIAARLADLPIVTSDNPRSEVAMDIIAEIETGLCGAGLARISRDEEGRARGYLVEPDRRSAIALALGIAGDGDVVLIAGKGHEDYQLVGDRVLKFDDREVVRELATGLGG